MITKIETTTTKPEAKGGNGLLYLICGAVIFYLGYKYIIKPQAEKNKLDQEQK